MPESDPQLGNGEMTRRDALKIAGTSLASTTISTLIQTTPTGAAGVRRSKRVLIAGGGIGGLCCGYELMKRGHDVTVLEASGRTGGHVFTVHDPLAEVDDPAHQSRIGFVRLCQAIRSVILDPLLHGFGQLQFDVPSIRIVRERGNMDRVDFRRVRSPDHVPATGAEQ